MTRLRFAHASLQFSDTPRQQKHDVKAIFERLDEAGIDFFTGTEAGPETENDDLLREYGAKHGFRLTLWRSNFVSVRRSIIAPGSWSAGSVFVRDNDDVFGHGHDSGFPWVHFEHADETVGEVALAGVHYPTHGKVPGDPNFDVNEEYARALGKWGREKGRGSALAFVGGDYNMPDDKPRDLFFGEPFTTAADEIGDHPNTGHGAIDGIASWNADGRVKATDWRVFNDRRFPLASDHFYTEADFDVKPLRKGKATK